MGMESGEEFFLVTVRPLKMLNSPCLSLGYVEVLDRDSATFGGSYV